MRPRRYPYRGEKESTFVKAAPKLVQRFLRNTSFLERLQKSLSISDLIIAERKTEGMAKLNISLRSTSVDEAIEKIARIKEAHPEDVLQIDVTILDDHLLNS
nr:MAG TPA: hypothetical protein [Caudoviricetes sp.]